MSISTIMKESPNLKCLNYCSPQDEFALSIQPDATFKINYAASNDTLREYVGLSQAMFEKFYNLLELYVIPEDAWGSTDFDLGKRLNLLQTNKLDCPRRAMLFLLEPKKHPWFSEIISSMQSASTVKIHHENFSGRERIIFIIEQSPTSHDLFFIEENYWKNLKLLGNTKFSISPDDFMEKFHTIPLPDHLRRLAWGEAGYKDVLYIE